MGISKKSETLMVLDDSFVIFMAFAIGGLFTVIGLYTAFFADTTNLFIGLIFAGVGTLVLLVVKRNEIALDKTTGRMTAKYFSMIGSKRFECSLSQIVKVSFSQIYGSSGSNTSTIGLALSDGTIMSYPNMVENPIEARQVALFLGVPLEAKGPPTFSEAAQAMKQTAEYWAQKGAEQKQMDKKFEQ